MMVAEEVRVPIHSEADVVVARQTVRQFAAPLGFTSSDLTVIATAVSEAARNIVSYASRGEILVSATGQGRRRGIAIVARDEGPGIADVQSALLDGYSTGGGLGLGMPGMRRLMDEFEVASELGKGTTVTMRKWAP
jgi:serine/threonine-protein kinase RsbT